jgi:hypothetical protein
MNAIFRCVDCGREEWADLAREMSVAESAGMAWHCGCETNNEKGENGNGEETEIKKTQNGISRE